MAPRLPVFISSFLPFSFVLLALCSAQAPPAPPLPALSSYAYSLALDPHRLSLHWSVNVSDLSIHLAVAAQTDGWVALGISEVGAMVGSDAMLGWVGNGSAVMTDRFIFNKSVDGSGVALDAQQDVHVVAGQTNFNNTSGEWWTILHWWRLLNTSDLNDRVISQGESVSLIWALGPMETLGYHGLLSRGGVEVVLYPSASSPTQVMSTQPASRRLLSHAGEHALEAVVPSLHMRRDMREYQEQVLTALGRELALAPSPPTYQTPIITDQWVNMSAPNYTVPTNFTTYACTAFTVDLGVKKQVSEWGVIVNTAHPELLHHMLVYLCQGGDKPDSAEANYMCFGTGGCNAFYATWALGKGSFVLPENVGLPLGAEGYTTFVLQTHYTNPEGLQGVDDNSGIYFKLTDTPRAHDAGMMVTGVLRFLSYIRIPPGMPAWTQDNTCPSACTSLLDKSANNTGVTIIASALHQHETGKQVYTNVSREGQFLQTLWRQDYFDFAFQAMKLLPQPLTLLPGDELTTRCVFDTSKSNTTVFGGFASNEEMCYNFILYYPDQPVLSNGCGTFCLAVPIVPDPMQALMIARNASSGFNCSANPSNCTLLPYAYCSFVIPLNATQYPCPSLSNYMDIYGRSDIPFVTLAGNPANTMPLSSLAMSAVSVPAVPSTSLPPPPPSGGACAATDPSGNAATYSSCSVLEGNFKLYWNVMPSAAAPASSASLLTNPVVTTPQNVTLCLRFSGTSPGWLGLAFSPSGQMVGSSAIVGWPGTNGSTIQPLYLGGKQSSLITQGNQLQVLGSAVNISAAASGTAGEWDVVLYANISIPASMASSVQKVIWAKGPLAPLNGVDWPAQHAFADAHMGTLMALDCTQMASTCQDLGLTTASPPPPPKAAGAAFPSLLAVVCSMALWFALL